MLNELKNATNVAYTANGARAYATTGTALIDLFATIGALRNQSDSQKISAFTKAYAENPELAMKMLFYSRDVRGGQGERDTFRVVAKYMADKHTDSMAKNLVYVPLFGRWDDLYVFAGTKLEGNAFKIMREQFNKDLNSEHPSLLAKWLKGQNSTSRESKKLAKLTRKYFGFYSDISKEVDDSLARKYRKALSALRNRIQIVESQMSANEWTSIRYDSLPSQAGLRYRQAFYRHDEIGYTAYVNSLKKGTAKVNTRTLFPYEIVREIMDSTMVAVGNKYNVGVKNRINNEDVLDAMWNNLPNYCGDSQDNVLAVVDTSGSMRGLPIEIAISLGIYAAERIKGKFHNHFMTFSTKPQLVELQGTGIVERVRNMSRATWDASTNIEAVFNLILDTAVQNRLEQSEMIDRIMIISDMQFDRSDRGGNSVALFENIRKRYEDAGYTMPKLVFWNVNAYVGNQPAKMTDNGVQLVSGASSSIFTNLLRGRMLTAEELMLDVLTSDRYAMIEA